MFSELHGVEGKEKKTWSNPPEFPALDISRNAEIGPLKCGRIFGRGFESFIFSKFFCRMNFLDIKVESLFEL